jgi:hypothetical protein
VLCACVRESVRAFARRCRRWEGHTVVSKEDEPIGEANAAQPARVIVNAPRLFGPSVPHLTSAATEGGGTVSRASSRTAPETHTPSCRYTYVVVAALTTPPGGWGGVGSGLGGGSSGFQLAFQLVFQLVDENDPGRPATYSEGCRASRAGR